MYLLGYFATKQGSQDILKYKYQTSGYSYLENLLNPYYMYVHSFIPKDIPPAAISFFGQAFVVLAFFRILMEDPSLSKSVDGISYLLFALSVFIY